jgi:beta-phosphoglucomutase-like phosphatase (HAD superfamily)
VARPGLRAPIFDGDGVPADSEPVHAAATRKELPLRGITIPHEFFDDHIGRRVSDQMVVLAELYGTTSARCSRLSRAVSGRRRLNSSARCPAALKRSALHAIGPKIAMATSETREWNEHVIGQFGVTDEISAITSAADVQEPKPHPQKYLAAAAALGVPAQSRGVVEDSERGCRSALAAECLRLRRDIKSS